MHNNLIIIIDSGIDIKNKNLMDHVVGGCHYKYENGEIQIDDHIDDCFGHGTNCADIILEMNSDALFFIIKIIDDEGLSYSELMLESLKKCLQIPARVICMSLSITTDTCKLERKMYDACMQLNKQGKIVCISENNEKEHSEPARFDQVIGVKAYYGGRKNIWIINEKADIQVTTDGNPVFVMGKKGEYNFFKGCSKANAFFVAVIMNYFRDGGINNMNDALNVLKRGAVESVEIPEEQDFGIGNVPQTELDIQIENTIIDAIYEISGCKPKIEELRELPIMCKITGISFFNFYKFLMIIFTKSGIHWTDFHQLDANDICTLYRLRQFVKGLLDA